MRGQFFSGVVTLLLLLANMSLAQQQVISGNVTDATDQSPLIGVNVLLKGAAGVGTVTDFDGNYKLVLPTGTQDPVLAFSMVGYKTKDVSIVNQSILNVSLEANYEELEEVVVTAFGIEHEKKTLNYTVQQVDGADLVQSGKQNIAETLSGKVAGVQITQASGSPGAASQILIRGVTSLSDDRDNQPLIVIDGLPVVGGGGILDVNMNDVETLNVLKGAAATALYGIDASQGAIVITTKSGKNGQTRVNFSTSHTIDQPLRIAPRQEMYMQGVNGIYNDAVFSSWGAMFLEGDQIYSDNTSDFFQDGLMQKYDLSVSGGSEKTTFYTSVNVLDQTGVVPTEHYQRIGLLAKGTIKMSERVSFNTSLNYVKSNTTRLAASMFTIYNWPLNNNMSDYLFPNGEKKWLIDQELQFQGIENPYWIKDNNFNVSESDRLIGQVSASWKPIKELDLTYRVGTDIINSYSRRLRMPLTAGILGGSISDSDRFTSRTNSTFNITFDKKFAHKVRVTALVGNNVELTNTRSTSFSGVDFLNPDFISLENFNATDKRYSQYLSNRIRAGVYTDVKVDYDGYAFIGASYRNDWSSSLPEKNNPFNYPSFSAGFIFSEVFAPNSNVLSFGKLMANWARVGKDANPHSTTAVLEPYPGYGGGYKYDYYAGNPDLMPEITESWEIGLDTRFFNGKIGANVALYDMTSINQIMRTRVTPASGWIMQTFNAGSIKNRGWEIILDQKTDFSPHFNWSTQLNFSRNKSTLVELPSHMSEMIVTAGQVLGTAKPATQPGYPVQGITGSTYIRNEDGRIVVDENGYPRIGAYLKDENGDYVLEEDGSRAVDYSNQYLGNREPDWQIGLTNDFKYKGWSLGFMFHFRKGGDVINATASSMYSNGTHKNLEQYRNHGIVIDGVVEQADGTFAENTKEILMDREYFSQNFLLAGENFVEDASWVRLDYIKLGYQLPLNLVEKMGMKNLELSFTARNLGLWTKYSGADPNTIYGSASTGGGGTNGVDYYGVPSIRSFSFNLNATF
ncbi:SusC/RagA family TonB-linked outer membrane protein [Sediminitomix flava]|uniref:TonB-linked SusC/RagA family outer membrane protein n=1 Tax=Sediminitomix flava TaxID=379075 RepID=A0A315ZG63_SEDFL|nr:SusC/RagA family TonB-linked outer membrane protein [Sediminitomix flava]PWJ43848.1 TonB-linked SusC/RagA family outer membrane protein [Sediminitomix flava]